MQIELLKQQLLDAQNELTSLRSLVDMYGAFEDMARRELIETKEQIAAQEKIFSYTVSEKSQTSLALQALLNTQELSRKEMLRKNETLKQVLKIHRKITQIPHRGDLFISIIRALMPLLNAERAILFLYKKNQLQPKILVRISKEELEQQSFAPSKIMIKRCLESQQSIIHIPDMKQRFHERAMICSPLQGKNFLGIIYLDTKSDDHSFKNNDLEIVEIFCAQAAIAMENLDLYSKLEYKVQQRTAKLQESYNQINNLYREIETDLRMAKKIQTSTLPRIRDRVGCLNVDIMYLPAAFIGGDIYDIFQKNDHEYRILLADATGHGIQAALVTMLIHGEYNKLKETTSRIDELAKQLNRDFYKKFHRLAIMFSFILIDLDVRQQKLYYCSGGHPPQFLIQGGQISELTKTGKIIGLAEESSYKTLIKDFRPGDKLFLFTDGIFEEYNQADEMFGEEKLKEIVLNHADDSFSIINSVILKELYEFTGSVALEDDTTMLSIEFAQEDDPGWVSILENQTIAQR